MVEEKVLVVGLGEVGAPLYHLLKRSGSFLVYGFDVDEAKMRGIGQKDIPSEANIMHICIPCLDRDEFIDVTVDYVERFKPELVIINSTVPPGTTLEVHRRCGGCLVAHSPVRGVHKDSETMKRDLTRWTKYIGGANARSGKACRTHFEMAGFETKVMRGCLETELAKLFETTYRAWMIVCFQEMHRISRHFKADFDEVTDFLEDTHRVRLDRPVMFPGVIGGHCLIPNVKLLLRSYDSKFLRLTLTSNEQRKREVKEKCIQSDVSKVRRRAKALERELMKES